MYSLSKKKDRWLGGWISWLLSEQIRLQRNVLNHIRRMPSQPVSKTQTMGRRDGELVESETWETLSVTFELSWFWFQTNTGWKQHTKTKESSGHLEDNWNFEHHLGMRWYQGLFALFRLDVIVVLRLFFKKFTCGREMYWNMLIIFENNVMIKWYDA